MARSFPSLRHLIGFLVIGSLLLSACAPAAAPTPTPAPAKPAAPTAAPAKPAAPAPTAAPAKPAAPAPTAAPAKPAATAAPAKPAAGPKVTIRMTWAVPRIISYAEAAYTYSEKAQQRLASKNVDFQFFPDGKLGGGDQTATQGVLAGSWEIGHISTQNLAAYTKRFQMLDLPYILKDHAEARKVLGLLRPSWDAALEQAGLKALMWQAYGLRNLVSSKGPIKTPKDMKGIKFRVTDSPIQRAIFTAWGSLPTPIPFLETYTGIQQGIVNGESNTNEVLLGYKFHEVTKFATLNNYQWAYYVLVTSKKFWDTLSKDVQDELNKISQEQENWLWENSEKYDVKAIDAYKASGLQVYAPNADEMREWRQASKPVWDQFVKPGQVEPAQVEEILKALGKTQADIFR